MIAAGDLQEFAPRGREHCRRHPSALTLQLRRLQPASELCSSDGAAGLVGSLREVTIHERQRVRGRGSRVPRGTRPAAARRPRRAREAAPAGAVTSPSPHLGFRKVGS